jgi:type VI secretion system secreted protein VgrG
MPILRNANEAMFRIRVEGVPDDELRVLRLRGEEGISQLFRFDVEIVSENPSIDFSSLIGKAAALEMSGADGDRYVNGIVCRFEQGRSCRASGASCTARIRGCSRA